MNPQQANRYLKTQVQTASKEQLLLMLFDGAIRFGEQARTSLKRQDFEASCNQLVQGERIIIELMSALSPEGVEPTLYENLMGLYNFIYQRFVDANLHRNYESLDEAIPILVHLRDTWSEAIRNQAGDGKRKDLPQFTAHPNSSGLCVEG